MVDENNQDQDETEHTTEPERMSWFVFSFMAMCLFMTAVMSYYAWRVFQGAV